MIYQFLVIAWKNYDRKYKENIQQGWDVKYQNSIDSGIWADARLFIEEKVDFLEKWGCRVDRTTAIQDIKGYSEQFSSLLREISSLNLLGLNRENLELIKKIYRVLVRVNGLGPTGITKYLHMHKPDLFIMWDKQIFLDYFSLKIFSKVTATPERYVKFLLRMRSEIQEAFLTFPASENISDTQTVNEFRRSFNNETIPRILDKYNYATRGQQKDQIE